MVNSDLPLQLQVDIWMDAMVIELDLNLNLLNASNVGCLWLLASYCVLCIEKDSTTCSSNMR
jgi:hypothetical protein